MCVTDDGSCGGNLPNYLKKLSQVMNLQQHVVKYWSSLMCLQLRSLRALLSDQVKGFEEEKLQLVKRTSNLLLILVRDLR